MVNNYIFNTININQYDIIYDVWYRKKHTISLDSNGGSSTPNIEIKNGAVIKLPDNPIKEGFIFGGWSNEKGNIVIEGTKITEDITLKALWISNDIETITTTFNTGNEIENIIIEKGKAILPINPTKTGFVFIGWVDGNGNSVTKDTVINDDIAIKAVWKEAYTCPSDCVINEDGKTCTKTLTKKVSTIGTCPAGYTLKENQCLDLSKKYYANSLGEVPWWGCNDSNHGQYDDCYGGGCDKYCAPKTSKVTTTGCSSGYTKDGDICKKTQVVKCTAN